MSKLRGTLTLALLSCFIMVTWGCDVQQQALPKPKVVRKKIVVPKPPTALAQNPVQATTPAATVGKSGTGKRAAIPVAKRIVTAELRPKSDIAATPEGRKASIAVTKKSTAPLSGPIVASPPQAKSMSGPAAKSDPKTPAGHSTDTPKVTKPPTDPIRRPVIVTKAVVQEKPAIESVPSSAAVIQPATKLPPSSPAAAIPAEPVQKIVAAGKPTVSTSVTAAVDNKGGTPAHYNPLGRINPFEPLFKDEPETPIVAAKKKRRVPRTPLERIDLGQLKLVGIIMASSGNRALVQEASGKGYIIKEGTYIGLHSGKVTEIKRDRVLIEEDIDEVVGTQKMRNKELVLPKPPGE